MRRAPVTEAFSRKTSFDTPFPAQGVWASKYNERALLSMRKVGLDFRDLRMAVLVQRVVPAAYAFVLHTHNPSTGARALCPLWLWCAALLQLLLAQASAWCSGDAPSHTKLADLGSCRTPGEDPET